MIALIIIALVVSVIAVLLLLPVCVKIKYSKNDHESKFALDARFIFFKLNGRNKFDYEEAVETLKQISLEAIDDVEDDVSFLKKIGNRLDVLKYVSGDIAKILSFIAKKVIKINKLIFSMNFGLEDPMSTGIATGVAGGVVYNLLALVHNIFTLDDCKVDIEPDFERTHIDIYSECILKIKVVHIISVIFKVLKMYVKIIKYKENRKTM